MNLSLPVSVLAKLERLLAPFPRHNLQKAGADLSQAYRENQNSKDLFQDPATRGAYLATRLPATFACLKQVLSLLPQKEDYASFLDLGAGPATACGALHDLGFSFQALTCWEQNGPLFQEGASLWDFPKTFAPSWNVFSQPLAEDSILPEADLVTLGFFLGELPSPLEAKILEKAWAACRKTLVIVEPGTPYRFEKMRLYRQFLLQSGGHLLAPCPHDAPCPLTPPDWCHFCVRIERSTLHRRLKNVTHPFELEKYSYLVVTKTPPQKAPRARVLAQPQKKSGHLLVDLCTPQGTQQRQVISKKDKKTYHVAKQLRWGDDYG